MPLSDELEELARSAPPTPDPDLIIRLARARRSRRLFAAPLLLVFIVAVPALLFSGGGNMFASPGATLVIDIYGRGDEFDQVAEIMRRRAERLGFDDLRVKGDVDVLRLEAATVSNAQVDALIVPGRLQVRTVLRQADVQRRSPVPAQGFPARTRQGVLDKIGGDLNNPAIAALTPPEVALLPASVQFDSPLINCDQLEGQVRALPAGEEVTVCSEGKEKLLLSKAYVVGADVEAASTAYDKQTGSHYIALRMTRAGGPKWTDLVRDANRGRIASIVDDQLMLAPEAPAISAAPRLELRLTREQTAELAAVIGPNELPAEVSLSVR